MFEQSLRLWAIVVAAGSSSRFKHGSPFGLNLPKQYWVVGGHPIIAYSLYTVSRLFGIQGIVLVLPKEGDYARVSFTWEDYVGDVPLITCSGGDTRCESVRCGLRLLSTMANDDDWVAVHDAARPALTFQDCQSLMISLVKPGIKGSFLVFPEVDAIKEIDDGGQFLKSVQRSGLYRAQTPQIFRYKLLYEALSVCNDACDEVSAVEFVSGSEFIRAVLGGSHNMKLTYSHDLSAIKSYLETHPLFDCLSSLSLRVGYGYDSHRLLEGLPLVIGGVSIPHSSGLVGHSDADVLLHALMDAMLGGSGKKDIGYYFPSTDSRYKNADSLKLLGEVCSKLVPMRVVNVDATIIAQEPRISSFIDRMKQNISMILGIDVSRIGIKCKTAELMGAIGRCEGIAAQVVVSLKG
ncbi:2-C-methyl-D-erythritol 2,4-cyclodiphosphate synthase [Candidatus Ichthyocystis sparus]|uniref:2-C-methyl-D-erythritol 2,4-cyclodiphosphate synthase n=1 Tax=Candidatus Ichthyocystis sparus TaxID=1561004 RepID=UPI000B1BA5B0|nr:2-C-methyl-D-erythritol 2,4-cyclodiphosphate synthase [Candidatus Ichthyocystis sparus]